MIVLVLLIWKLYYLTFIINGIFHKGFGDAVGDTVFQSEILLRKNDLKLLIPISAFALVIKFNADRCPSFFVAAKQIARLLGRETLKSLIIICIQGNERRIYSDTEFENILYSSDGYRHLLDKNFNVPIPYCLWDNFKPYLNQEEKLISGLNRLELFTMVKFNYMICILENNYEDHRERDEERRRREEWSRREESRRCRPSWVELFIQIYKIMSIYQTYNLLILLFTMNNAPKKK